MLNGHHQSVSPYHCSAVVLSDDDFPKLCDLVRRYTGIALSEMKREMLYGRLIRRLDALRLPSFSDYIQLINDPHSGEVQEFINTVTTNQTSFFREMHHFEHLEQHLLQKITSRFFADQRLRIWSCACSTGEEPYSIAMILDERRDCLTGIDVKVLATDIDTAVLSAAAAGIYGSKSLDMLPHSRSSRYFELIQDHTRQYVKVAPTLQELITFKQLNLMGDWPMKGPFDVIFCRNVIIYFDLPTRKRLFERFAALQRPGDLLYVGYSENLNWVTDQYERVGRAIYQRLDDRLYNHE